MPEEIYLLLFAVFPTSFGLGLLLGTLFTNGKRDKQQGVPVKKHRNYFQQWKGV